MDIVARVEDRWQPPAECKGNDAAAASGNERITNNIKCVNLRFERLKGGGNIFRTPDLEWHDFEAQRTRCSVDHVRLRYGFREVSIKHNCQQT